MEELRVVAPERREEDAEFDVTLRPRSLAEYIGQSRVKENLKIFVQAARDRREALDHVSLYGPPGLGKTTLAHIIAAELGVPIRVTSGPVIERAGDLAAILTNLESHEVLFIDEVHRLNRTVEEILYSAMEEFALDIIIGKGPSARSVRIDLPRFTLVGATTRAGALSSPLRDRFGIIDRLEYYTSEELEEIIIRAASILEIPIEREGARELATRARGTPRIANRLLKRVRDFAQVKGEGVITAAIARWALDLLEVDRMGLDRVDRLLLETIVNKFDGGPVGVDTLAAATQEAVETIEDVCEPYLLQIGFLQRTPRGRVVTRRGMEHLGITPKSRKVQEQLKWQDNL